MICNTKLFLDTSPMNEQHKLLIETLKSNFSTINVLSTYGCNKTAKQCFSCYCQSLVLVDVSKVRHSLD